MTPVKNRVFCRTRRDSGVSRSQKLGFFTFFRGENDDKQNRFMD